MTKKNSSPTAKSESATKVEAVPRIDPPSPAALQLVAFEQAVRLFSQGRFAQALEGFANVAKGPAAHISDKARSYAQVCERRTRNVAPELTTAEDHFNYGVERLNSRDFEVARRHLGEALRKEPRGDHILYTLALCCGLEGDGNGACENLKRAIDLEPRNRILARQDPEFSALAQQLPGLRALL